MAVSQFSATSNEALLSHSDSRSSGLFRALASRPTKSKVLLMRTWSSRTLTVRRSFSVNNVSSDSKQKLNDPITQQGLCFALILSFHFYFYHFDFQIFILLLLLLLFFKLIRERGGSTCLNMIEATSFSIRFRSK